MVNTKAEQLRMHKGMAEAMPANIMFDRRVVRGNTYAPRIVNTERSSLTTTAAVNKPKQRKSREVKEKFSWRRSGMTTPEPVEGRLHVDIQTDSYLEEISDEQFEVEHATQTDEFFNRPLTPLFIPAKSGIDTSTQIEPGETFDFDFEVEPIVESIVGKVLEQSAAEVVEELEIEAMRNHREEMQQRRTEELAATQQIEMVEKRLLEEKDRRLAQAEEKKEREDKIKKRVAAQTCARGYLNGIVKNVFQELNSNGYFYDPVKKQVESEFLPWLMSTVESKLQRCLCVDQVMTAIVKQALKKQEESCEKALECHKEKIREARLKKEAQLEAERKFRQILADKATILLDQTDPAFVDPALVEQAKESLRNQADKPSEEGEEVVIPDDEVLLELIRVGVVTKEIVSNAVSNLNDEKSFLFES